MVQGLAVVGVRGSAGSGVVEVQGSSVGVSAGFSRSDRSTESSRGGAGSGGDEPSLVLMAVPSRTNFQCPPVAWWAT